MEGEMEAVHAETKRQTGAEGQRKGGRAGLNRDSILAWSLRNLCSPAAGPCFFLFYLASWQLGVLA